MRIIAGKARGIILIAGKSLNVRPTTDRIKESLFNMLQITENSIVVDLFAGSGSLGLEALSRGAKDVYFFEKDNKAVEAIKTNITKVVSSMKEGRTHLFAKKAQQAPLILPELAKRLDYIFADPPYDCLASLKFLSSATFKSWAKNATIILETSSKKHIEKIINDWQCIKKLQTKTTTIYIAKIN